MDTKTTRETFTTHWLNGEAPTYAIGQVLTFPRIGLARVFKIHPAGTIDVENERGAWRITGLRGSNWT